MQFADIGRLNCDRLAKRKANNLFLHSGNWNFRRSRCTEKPTHKLLKELDTHTWTLFDIIKGETQYFPAIKNQMILPTPLVGELGSTYLAGVRRVTVDFNRQLKRMSEKSKVEKTAAITKIFDFILGMEIVE